MRFPPAGWAWPPGPRVAAAHNSGVDGRRDGREKGPMQATSGPQRDKTRPAARLGGPPGTKLSQQAPKRRFRPTFRMQGELYPACRAASGTKLSQQAALTGPPGTKLSQQAALAGPPGTKLSQQAPKRRFRPTFRMQGELCTASATNNPSRENFIPHAEPLPVQNSPSTPGSAAHPVQNSPSKRLGGPPGTKLSQQAPKRRFRPTFRMQGELCTASATNTTSREKKVTHQHPTAPTNAPLPKFRMQFD